MSWKRGRRNKIIIKKLCLIIKLQLILEQKNNIKIIKGGGLDKGVEFANIKLETPQPTARSAGVLILYGEYTFYRW